MANTVEDDAQGGLHVHNENFSMLSHGSDKNNENYKQARVEARSSVEEALECARVALLYNLLYLSLDCITSRDRLLLLRWS